MESTTLRVISIAAEIPSGALLPNVLNEAFRLACVNHCMVEFTFSDMPIRVLEFTDIDHLQERIIKSITEPVLRSLPTKE